MVVNNTGVWSVLAGAKRVLSVCVLIIITQDIKSLAAVCAFCDGACAQLRAHCFLSAVPLVYSA